MVERMKTEQGVDVPRPDRPTAPPPPPPPSGGGVKPPSQGLLLDKTKSLGDIVAIDVVRIRAFKHQVILRAKNRLFDSVAFESASEARANRKAEELARETWGAKEKPIVLRTLTPFNKREWSTK